MVRDRVKAAREAAAERWREHGVRTNAEVSGVLLRRRFRLEADVMAPLKTALDRGLLSIRGVDRTLLKHVAPEPLPVLCIRGITAGTHDFFEGDLPGHTCRA